MSYPKIYIPHMMMRYDAVLEELVPAIDINAARVYGEFVLLFSSQGAVSREQLPLAIATLKDRIKPITADDYILAVGDFALATAAIYHACKKNGVARLLRWDKTTRSYSIQEMEL